MRYRHFALATLFVTSTLAAQPALTRGTVVVQTAAPRESLTSPWIAKRYVLAPDGSARSHVSSFTDFGVGFRPTPPAFFSPAPDQLFFTGTAEIASSADAVTSKIVFQNSVRLTETVPMRSGHFLVAEAKNNRHSGAYLIEIDAAGVEVARIRFPDALSSITNEMIGAQHMELLSDQCTLLYNLGTDHQEYWRIRRFDICAGEARPDFASLPMSFREPGSIRQLPNSDVLIATGGDVRHYSRDGLLLRTYPVFAQYLSLSPDGGAFWAADTRAGGAIRRIDLSNPSGPGPFIQLDFTLITGMAVVGEWRASSAPRPRGRAVRR